MCPLHCTCTDPQTTTPQTSARPQVMRSNLLQSAAISYTSPLNVCVSSKSNFLPLQQFPINYQLSITHCPIARFHPSSSAPSHCNQFQTFHSTAIVRHSPRKKTADNCFPLEVQPDKKKCCLFALIGLAGHRSQLNVPLCAIILWADINHSV